MTRRKATTKITTTPIRREPTDRERRAMAKALEAQAKRTGPPALKVEGVEASALQVGSPHGDEVGFGAHVREAFGTTSNSFSSVALSRMELVLRNRDEDYSSETRLNAALAVLNAIAPRDELEAVIGGQIIAADALSMHLMSKAKHAETMDKLEAFTNLATKVSRSMAAHVETLARLRSGGKQQVIVKHVYVQGNAIVGDHAQTVVTDGRGGGSDQNLVQSLAAEFASVPAIPGLQMRGEDEARHALPVARGPGEAPLPDARWDEPRRAEGAEERELSDGAAHAGNGGAAPRGSRHAPHRSAGG